MAVMLQQLQPVQAQKAWCSRPSKVPPRVATAALSRRTVLGGLCCCSGCACSHRSKWYDTYFAYNMAVGMTDYEAAILPVKQQLFKQLFTAAALQPASSSSSADTGGGSSSSNSKSSSSGPIQLLEVGIGTGPNLPFYTPFLADSSSSSPLLDSSVTGLEPNTEMWGYAQEAAAAAGLQQQQLRLVEGDAQQMPFVSSSFDAAVMTLVLCSVPQPQAVLSELYRVLKPGGQLLLIEHVIAPQLGLLQVQQRLLNPLQRLLADNCHLTRDTAADVLATRFVPQPLPPLPLQQGQGGGSSSSSSSAVLDDAGFVRRGSSAGSNSSSSSSMQGVPGAVDGSVDLWRFEVAGMGLIAPHAAGVLRKPL